MFEKVQQGQVIGSSEGQARKTSVVYGKGKPLKFFDQQNILLRPVLWKIN